MFFTGKMKLRDRRVERILQAQGFQDAEIFHGPQKEWWIVMAIMFVMGGFLIPAIHAFAGWYWAPVLVLYLLVGSVLSGRYYYSIALTETALIFINPNRPFKRLRIISLEEVKLVVMGERQISAGRLLCLFGTGYIEVGTDTGLELFNCAGIDLHDGYGEEGFTEKTLEDLGLLLKQKGIPVQLLES